VTEARRALLTGTCMRRSVYDCEVYYLN
jgi:hypothetical protein